MKRVMNIFLLVLVVVPAACISQVPSPLRISGEVVDALDLSPLAFVNIHSEGKRTKGGVSDLDGSFDLTDIEVDQTVVFSYVGYRPLQFDAAHTVLDTIIKLRRDLSVLPVFEVLGQKNPGPELAARLVNALPQQNPNVQLDFSCKVYTKLKMTLQAADSSSRDSINASIDSLTKGGDLMLMESVVRYKHKAPNLTEQAVEANRASGFKQPEFAVLLTDFQPFGFYDRYVQLVDESYLSPISKKGIRNYNYLCRDTIIEANDSVFIVEYKPRSYGADRFLTGLIYIRADGSILQNIVARPALPGLINFEIEQSYQVFNAGVWYPHRFRFALSLKDYPSGKTSLTGESMSHISSFQALELKRSDIAPIPIRSEPKAWAKDESYWHQYRPAALRLRETITYERMDSIGDALGFDYINALVAGVTQGRVPLGPVDLSLPELLMVNRHENFRPGLGLTTNNKLSERFTLSGYFGYGTGDRLPKYSTSISINPSRKRHLKIELKYFNTLAEAGNHKGIQQPSLFSFRDLLGSAYDRLEGYYLRSEFSVTRNLRANTWFISSQIDPQYNNFSDAFSNSTLRQSNLGLSFHYAAKTRAIKQGFKTLITAQGYPRLDLSLERGLQHLGGDLDFWKYTACISHRFQLLRMLNTHISMSGGFIDRPLPFGMLFTGQGSFLNTASLFIPYHFQTMGLYEFTSDQFIQVNVKQELFAFMKENTRSSPLVSIEHATMYGALSADQMMDASMLISPKDGFHESGIMIDRLLRLKYINLIYLDLGMGVYYRYGPYSNSDWTNNIALRFGVKASTR